MDYCWDCRSFSTDRFWGLGTDFAPAVKITVAMSTSASNFSEEVRFTTDQNAVSLDNNVLFAEKQTLEQEYKADFSATGEKKTVAIVLRVQ